MTLSGLKVGLVGPLPPPSGGMANQTRQLAALLAQEGIQVDTVQINSPYRPHWIRHLKGARAIFRLIPYLFRLWRVAGNVQLFHIMANSGWAWHLFTVPAVWIAKLRRVPVLVNYRGGGGEAFFARSFFWIKPTMRRVDRLVVPSDFLRVAFAKFGLETLVVPNIVDLSRFAPVPLNARQSSSGPHLIVTRNLEPIYDIGTALRAFAIVRRALPAATMTVAGSGPDRDKLAALAKDLGIFEHVVFTGRLDNESIAQLYKQADVFVNTSLVDNMPISILESLASGVPVVSTRVGGIPFLVEHDRTALLVPPGNAEAVAVAILDLLRHESKAKRLIETGLDYVRRYNWQSVRSQLFSIYFDMVRNGKRNSSKVAL